LRKICGIFFAIFEEKIGCFALIKMRKKAEKMRIKTKKIREIKGGKN